MDFFEWQGYFYLALLIAMLAVKGFALVSALTFSGEAYEAAGKLTKPTWSIGLGLGFVAQVLMQSPTGLINLVFVIAAFVYLADVRPALSSVVGRR